MAMKPELDISAIHGRAQDVMARAVEQFQPQLALACSFSLEDVVLVHMLQALRTDTQVFALDTGRLNEETFECAEALRRHWGIKIDWFCPNHEEVERLEREQGLFSFRESLAARHACCHIRKVVPLARALTGLRAWITGMRREQSTTRTTVQPVEHDALHGNIVKLNPLAAWTTDEVWAYTREHKLPYNRLYDGGYASIGCAPCTRAIQPGEHPRAGRWWWENPEHRECGLHVRHTPP